MEVSEPLQQVQSELLVHATSYKFCIEAVAVLCYIGYTDFRTFKIRNESVALLLVLYALYAIPLRPRTEILFDALFAAVVFGFLLIPYARKLIGGGDVKFLAVACLWTGTHCALLFSSALLGFIVFHLAAVRLRLAGTAEGSNLIAYGPSVAAALISTILLGCV